MAGNESARGQDSEVEETEAGLDTPLILQGTGDWAPAPKLNSVGFGGGLVRQGETTRCTLSSSTSSREICKGSACEE